MTGSVGGQTRGVPRRDEGRSATATNPHAARRVLRLVQGEWLGDLVNADARRFLATLLVGVYAADAEGKGVSKREACVDLMRTDVVRTGPKYINMAEELGLLTIQQKPEEDRRKDFLVPTARLRGLLEQEFAKLEEELGNKGSALEITKRLAATAQLLLRTGKGILAIDESPETLINVYKRSLGTLEQRSGYREALLRTKRAMQYISGVILHDETIRGHAQDGTTFVEMIQSHGAVPGIRVDRGREALSGHPGELVTIGLEGLGERLVEYAQLGAQFAKWRAVFSIGPSVPSAACISANARALTEYATVCIRGGLLPILEAEILRDGQHDIGRCAEVTERVLREIYEHLRSAHVPVEATLLMTNMVGAGKDGRAAEPEEVARRTVEVLRRAVPSEVPGIAFVSGGQLPADATRHLNLIAQISLPWKVTFAFGRGLQGLAPNAGRNAAIIADKQFAEWAEANGRAAVGLWKGPNKRTAAR